MGKYLNANPLPYTTLKYNPYQIAFLDALSQRYCPTCYENWTAQWGVVASLSCPKCGVKGRRSYNVAGLVAGRQGGKTRAATLAAALETSYPGSRGWICAPSYRDQEDFVKPAFFQQIPQSWLDKGNFQAADDLFIAPNGSTVAFRSLDNPDAVRGPTLDWLVMDEACKVSGKAFHIARPAMSTTFGVIIVTTTPKGEDWVYEDVMVPAETGIPGFWCARYKSIENPVQDAEFIESMRATMSPEMFGQEYEASIEVFQGAIYGKPMVNRCVIDDVDPLTRDAAFKRIQAMLPEWPNVNAARQAVVGIDPGSDHPFAGCLVVVTPLGLIVCGEYSKRELPAMMHASNLRVMAQGLSPRWGVDRSQAQMIIELAQHGIFAVPAGGGPGSVDAGIERVKSWMLSGQFFIVKSRCPKLIKELGSYRWKDKETSDGSLSAPEPYKKNDDLADALRYALMLWPHLPERAVVPGGRDLSKMPEKMARDIERVMKGMDAKVRGDEEPIPEGVGDFYTRLDEDDQFGYGQDEFYS